MNIEIANRLQKLRKENGYSQEELADKLGISRQAISKWERAESSPDTDNLIILARLYNMSLDELLYDNESCEEIRERNILSNKEKESISLTDDEGSTIKIVDGKLKFLNKDGNEVKMNKKEMAIKTIFDSIIFICTLLGFIIWGTMYDGWYISWILWIIMPAIMSIVEAILKKRISAFAYPCLIVGIYCFIGMKYDLWHPYWFLFITIPAFYLITGFFDKFVLKTVDIEE